MAESRAGKALPWIVLVVLLVGFGAYEYRTHHTSTTTAGDDPEPVATPTATGVKGVVVGDLPVTGGCYETHAGASAAADVTPLPKPCAGLHNTYVVSQQKYPDPAGTAYDEQEVADDGGKLCEATSTAYVKGSSATFTFLSIYPGRESWTGGDRTVVCLVRREGPDVVGALTQ